MASRRKEIVALLVDKLKEINGQAVGGTNYTYNLNVFTIKTSYLKMIR